MKIGELFSGYGGLGMGVQAVLGGEIAWHSEIDPGPCKVLAHRYPDVPNLGDITAIDWTQVEPVDVITGGSPCQDVSAAGKRAGMRAGTRSGLWASMCDAIDIIRPRLVVWENVRGVLSAHADSAVEPCPICVGDERDVHLRALGRVVGDLAELGYVGRWTGLRAADVGAPHGRFRVFVVAWPAADPNRLGYERGRRARHGWGGSADSVVHAPHAHLAGLEGVESAGGRLVPDRRVAAHPPRDGRYEGRPESARLVGGSDAALGGDAAADADSGERAGRERDPQRGALRRVPTAGPSGGDCDWGPYGPAVRRWESESRISPTTTKRPGGCARSRSS